MKIKVTEVVNHDLGMLRLRPSVWTLLRGLSSRPTDPRSRKCEEGSATIIFIALLSIMLILVTAEMRSLAQLHQEERFLEKQQMKRLVQAQSQPGTNTVAT